VDQHGIFFKCITRGWYRKKVKIEVDGGKSDTDLAKDENEREKKNGRDGNPV
jgi:hypothetical protein